jgi:hypothetical protein
MEKLNKNLLNNIFLENDEYETPEKIMSKIQKGELNDILSKLCFIIENNIIIDYIYFKYLATNTTYNYILMYITNNINNILLENNDFIVHVNMKKISLTDVDKHRLFIQNFSSYLKENYSDKLSKCYIYNAPGVFKQILNIISVFIDKETQTKIELVKNKT